MHAPLQNTFFSACPPTAQLATLCHLMVLPVLLTQLQIMPECKTMYRDRVLAIKTKYMRYNHNLQFSISLPRRCACSWVHCRHHRGMVPITHMLWHDFPASTPHCRFNYCTASWQRWACLMQCLAILASKRHAHPENGAICTPISAQHPLNTCRDLCCAACARQRRLLLMR